MNDEINNEYERGMANLTLLQLAFNKVFSENKQLRADLAAARADNHRLQGELSEARAAQKVVEYVEEGVGI